MPLLSTLLVCSMWMQEPPVTERRGEMMALEWTSIDFQRRLLTVERSEWKGHVTSPKGNKDPHGAHDDATS